jgi:hypothetical protein
MVIKIFHETPNKKEQDDFCILFQSAVNNINYAMYFLMCIHDNTFKNASQAIKIFFLDTRYKANYTTVVNKLLCTFLPSGI